MVTRFATSPPTDNYPQPKEAQPLSQLEIRLIQYLDSSALWFDGPEVALNWLFTYPIPNPSAPSDAVPEARLQAVTPHSVEVLDPRCLYQGSQLSLRPASGAAVCTLCSRVARVGWGPWSAVGETKIRSIESTSIL